MNLSKESAATLAGIIVSGAALYPSRFAIGDRVHVDQPAGQIPGGPPHDRLTFIGVVAGVQFTSGKVHYLVDRETQSVSDPSPTCMIDSAFVDVVQETTEPRTLEPALR